MQALKTTITEPHVESNDIVDSWEVNIFCVLQLNCGSKFLNSRFLSPYYVSESQITPLGCRISYLAV